MHEFLLVRKVIRMMLLGHSTHYIRATPPRQLARWTRDFEDPIARATFSNPEGDWAGAGGGARVRGLARIGGQRAQGPSDATLTSATNLLFLCQACAQDTNVGVRPQQHFKLGVCGSDVINVTVGGHVSHSHPLDFNGYFS